MPLASRIEQGFLRRLEPLPADTRRLLLTAAAEPVGDEALLWRAAARLGVGPDALVAAKAAGLIDVGARVRFRHPLVRSAAYRSASAHELQEVHRALAAVTDMDLYPDRRAWHRAHAAVGPDESSIGGRSAAQRNVISGNDEFGVISDETKAHVVIEGNYIGVGADGSRPLGNGRGLDFGVFDRGVPPLPAPDDGFVVGGTAAGTGNRIAHNTADSITIGGTTGGVTVLGNEIFANGERGIDFGDDGVSANGSRDPGVLPPSPSSRTSTSPGRERSRKGRSTSRPAATCASSSSPARPATHPATARARPRSGRSPSPARAARRRSPPASPPLRPAT